jgi:isopentenyl diphosphate isomerase/L-lactate dehydrogenase-like FMN-dependent dehydrogenase
MRRGGRSTTRAFLVSALCQKKIRGSRLQERSLLAQARDAGCDALVFTVDMPVSRFRATATNRSGLAEARPGLRGALTAKSWQALMRPRVCSGTSAVRCRPSRGAWATSRPHTNGANHTGLEDFFFAWMRNNFDRRVTGARISDVRALLRVAGPRPSSKGFLDADDAVEARKSRRPRDSSRLRITGSATPKRCAFYQPVAVRLT